METAAAVLAQLETLQQVVNLLLCNNEEHGCSKQATGEIYENSKTHQSTGNESNSSSVANSAVSSDSGENSKQNL